MCSTGDCYVVFPPHCDAKTVIFGRNSSNVVEEGSGEGVVQEVVLYEADLKTGEDSSSDGGVSILLTGEVYRVILQKPRVGVWGGDCGANSANVCVAITWAANEVEKGSGYLTATDFVRFALTKCDSADSAVQFIGNLLRKFASDDVKYNFVVCDPSEAWSISCAGKFYAAQRFTSGFQRFPCNGLTVTTTFEKCSMSCMEDEFKTLGLWNGEGDFNFAACFDAVADMDSTTIWSGVEPAGDGTYTLTSMFETLRASPQATTVRSATVSVLKQSGAISCHWFTATPNVIESVFKPFVFAPNPKISPLTTVPESDGSGLTLLHKLHAQRKPIAIEDLKALEASCVDEVNKYLAEHPEADDELDELMKDCVEAEVKFYR